MRRREEGIGEYVEMMEVMVNGMQLVAIFNGGPPGVIYEL